MVLVLLMICFSFYSFLGWILEVVYRSLNQKVFVNAGFLQGPFVPIYGVATTALIFLNEYSETYPMVVQFVLYALVASMIEYVISFLAERVLHLRLWSYSDNRFNIRGRICLKYSLIWGFFGIFFVEVLHPAVWGKVLFLKDMHAIIIAGLLSVYFVIDFTISVSLGRKLGHLLEAGYQRIIALEPFELEKRLRQEKRLLLAFSHIRKNMSLAISKKFENNISGVLEEYKSILSIKNIELEHLNDLEYIDCVSDILDNPEFLKTKNYKHHESTIFDHVIKVSFLAYKISRSRGWDYRSVARGALLHDFFLYDWRDGNDPGRPTKNWHGFRHPKIALNNAQAQFDLNSLERDIILKHMWPLTPFFPRYKESFLIVFLDKYVATYEFLKKPKRNKNKLVQKK